MYHWSGFDSLFFNFGIFGRELAGQEMLGFPKAVLTVSIVETLLCIFNGDF